MNKKLFRLALFYWAPFFFWMSLIFFFSSLKTFKTSDAYWTEFAIKKTAHVIEYAILAFFLFRALSKSGMKKTASAIISFLFSVFYGMTDEYHQSFVPGRESRIRDVGFDTMGAGISSCILFKYREKLSWLFG